MRLDKLDVPGGPYYLTTTGPSKVGGGWATFNLHFIRLKRRDRIAGRIIALWLLASVALTKEDS